jgi:hypothetical protein
LSWQAPIMQDTGRHSFTAVKGRAQFQDAWFGCMRCTSCTHTRATPTKSQQGIMRHAFAPVSPCC